MTGTKYIYVDYENVEETDLGCIEGTRAQLRLVLGKRHKSLPLSVVEFVHRYSQQVRLITTPLEGKNALDFVLAYEVGVEAAREPKGEFHIISRDKGFDALIEYLLTKNFRAARFDSLRASIRAVKPRAAQTFVPLTVSTGMAPLADAKVAKVAAFLQRAHDKLPRTRGAMESMLHANFDRGLSPNDVAQLVEGLVDQKWIEIAENGTVTYGKGLKRKPKAVTAQIAASPGKLKPEPGKGAQPGKTLPKKPAAGLEESPKPAQSQPGVATSSEVEQAKGQPPTPPEA